jgi:hypothetical protein
VGWRLPGPPGCSHLCPAAERRSRVCGGSGHAHAAGPGSARGATRCRRTHAVTPGLTAASPGSSPGRAATVRVHRGTSVAGQQAAGFRTVLCSARRPTPHAAFRFRAFPGDGASGAVNRWPGPVPVRYMSVTTATRRPATAPDDTRRHDKPTARWPRYPQATGRFRWWWQVQGSNLRRLSRRFYSPFLLPEFQAADQHLCRSRWCCALPGSAMRPCARGSDGAWLHLATSGVCGDGRT